MAKSVFDEKELVALREEIRAIRETLETLKARPVPETHPEYSVLVSSKLPPDYAVLVRSGNALPPDYAVLVRSPKDYKLPPEYAVAVRTGMGALPPDYAVLVRPTFEGPEEILVVNALKDSPALQGAKRGAPAKRLVKKPAKK